MDVKQWDGEQWIATTSAFHGLFAPISREQHIELIRHAAIPPMQKLMELFNLGLRGAELQHALRPVGVTFKRGIVTQL